MQRLPIGISNFHEIRTANYYFVDKSMLIADVVRSGAKVILLPRPRRFGKTLNLSMLKCFFSMTNPSDASLFEGLAVHDHQDVMAHCGIYPTIFLTFKDLKFDNFTDCYSALKNTLGGLYLEFEDLLKVANPKGVEEKQVRAVMSGDADPAGYQSSLALLSKLLHRATGKKAVILIDEYDIPIHAGFHHNYYQEILRFMRNLLSGAYKDNDHLEKGVLTGIMRIAKESIFSGFNNLDVHTVLDDPFSQYFGFTWDEVTPILSEFGLDDRKADVRVWYNGYRMGQETLFNPWSIMKAAAKPKAHLQAYWVNTSDNQLIRRLITEKNALSRSDLEILLSGDCVRKQLDTNIVLGRMNAESLWSMLTLSGYLTPRKIMVDEDGVHHCDLAVPNREVHAFFKRTIREWCHEQTGPSGLNPVLDALLEEDMTGFAHHFSEAVRHALSYHDTAGNTPERVYHVFLLGMLASLQGSYQVCSNRESGLGRYDILLIPRDLSKTGFVFEFKQTEGDLQQAAQGALNQIQDNDYGAALRQAGAASIRAVGVAMSGKQAAVETRALA